MVYDHTKVIDVMSVDTLKDPRRRIFEFNKDNVKFCIGGVHLQSGVHKKDMQTRLNELNEVLEQFKPSDK